MRTKQWTPPKDPQRSFKTRVEGMVRKAMELRKLGVRVALFCEKPDEGKVYRYKTDADFEPVWEDATDIAHQPSPPSPPPQDNNLSAFCLSPDARPSLFNVDNSSLRMSWPSAGAPTIFSQDWVTQPSSDDSHRATAPQPSRRTFMESPPPDMSRKRHRSVSADGEKGSPAPKKARYDVAWFD